MLNDVWLGWDTADRDELHNVYTNGQNMRPRIVHVMCSVCSSSDRLTPSTTLRCIESCGISPTPSVQSL